MLPASRILYLLGRSDSGVSVLTNQLRHIHARGVPDAPWGADAVSDSHCKAGLRWSSGASRSLTLMPVGLEYNDPRLGLPLATRRPGLEQIREYNI
jgi:hypothetical protein